MIWVSSLRSSGARSGICRAHIDIRKTVTKEADNDWETLDPMLVALLLTVISATALPARALGARGWMAAAVAPIVWQSQVAALCCC